MESARGFFGYRSARSLAGSRFDKAALEGTACAGAERLCAPGTRSALILGDHRQSLAVARSLHHAGYHVIAGRSGSRTILERSRHVAEVWQHPLDSDVPAWTAAIERFCTERADLAIVFPVGDREIEGATPLVGRVPAIIVVAQSLIPCRSKRALLSVAQTLGVPTQPWLTVDAANDLGPAVERIGLPAVLKPDVSTDDSCGFKASIIRSEADARRLAKTLPAGSTFVLQRFAKGLRHNVYFVASGGRLLGYAEIRVSRTDRPDGTGLAVEGESVPPNAALRDWTAAFAARLRYTGVGCAQFLVDEPSKSVSFLEINARLGANCAGTCACGHDLPRIFVETLTGVAEEQPPAQVGRRYTWLHGDLDGLKSSLDTRSITWRGAAAWLLRMAAAQLRARDHITWSWHDPLPSLTIHAQWLRASARGLVRRLTRP
jgi:predicted ATP-grasp superfamily ATP-dependent carboligase